jgi:deoxyribonuclease-4
VTEEALAALGGRRVGLHLPLAPGMVKAANRAGEIGVTCLQFFSDNPTAWRRRSAPPADLDAFKERLRDLDIAPLSVHGPYLVNLAGSDDAFWRRSIETLIQDLEMARLYGAKFVNIHIGSHRGFGREAGIGRLLDGITAVLGETPVRSDTPRLVLENSAGGGDGVGGTIEELAEIFDAVTGSGIADARIGLCLDTAHLWGAGYEVSEPTVVDQVVARFESLIGLRHLAMIHLNDSRSPKGSHMDRHIHVGAGLIGGAGLAAFLEHGRLRGVPFFSEPPGMEDGYDQVNMDRIRTLLRGEPLPELPPEAFELRRSRARVAGVSARSPKPGKSAPRAAGETRRASAAKAGLKAAKSGAKPAAKRAAPASRTPKRERRKDR